MRSGATSSAGRLKKAWGKAGRCWVVVVAMGVVCHDVLRCDDRAWEAG